MAFVPVESPEWLVLVHQIPPKPAYLRVKIGRRLARIGSVALKNSVYLLPSQEGCQEDFQWVLREVRGCGGDATLLRAQVVEGLSPAEVQALFTAEREREYGELLEQARQLQAQAEAEADPAADAAWRSLEGDLARIEKRFEEAASRDFFGALGREAIAGLLEEIRKRLTPDLAPVSAPIAQPMVYRNRVWVTRRGVHVDRIASAWLIRRFIDESATFKFVASKQYEPEPEELRFDMYDGEFTHEGDACTFEVLCSRFQLHQPGLTAIAELIHDLDIKDERYGRGETAGLAAQIQGITLLHAEDERRIELGSQLFEALLLHFAAKEKHG